MVDDDQIKSLIESNPYYTTQEIAEIIDVSQKTVCKNHLHTLGYVSRYDIWIPHNLSDKNLMDRISIYDLLHKRNENCPFFKWMITDDEILKDMVEKNKIVYSKRHVTYNVVTYNCRHNENILQEIIRFKNSTNKKR